jgi:hypothetical protein
VLHVLLDIRVRVILLNPLRVHVSPGITLTQRRPLCVHILQGLVVHVLRGTYVRVILLNPLRVHAHRGIPLRPQRLSTATEQRLRVLFAVMDSTVWVVRHNPPRVHVQQEMSVYPVLQTVSAYNVQSDTTVVAVAHRRFHVPVTLVTTQYS